MSISPTIRFALGSKSLCRALGAACVVAVASFGCSSSTERTGAEPESVVATVSASSSTLVTVSWTTAEPSIGYVEYGATSAFGLETAMGSTPTTTHALTLVGLTPDTDVYYRVVSWANGDAAASPIATTRTGSLPASLPALTVQAGQFDRYTVLPVSGTPPAVVVLSPEGRIVWYHLDTRGLELYRARYGVGGSGILYSAASPPAALATPGAIVRVAVDGTESVVASLPGLAGDFVVRSDGTIAAVVAEVRDVGGVATRGDSIVEIDAAGTQRVVWSAWNCFDPALNPTIVDNGGWAVVDSLHLDASGEGYYVGLRSLGSVARVTRTTGACEWILGQTAATVAYGDGVQAISGQRQFEATPDGANTRVMLVDSNADGSLRAVQFKFPPPTGPATVAWSALGPMAKSGSPLLAQPSWISTTRTLVNWATEGSVQLYDATGAAIWGVTAPEGVRFGLHAQTNDLYAVFNPTS